MNTATGGGDWSDDGAVLTMLALSGPLTGRGSDGHPHPVHIQAFHQACRTNDHHTVARLLEQNNGLKDAFVVRGPRVSPASVCAFNGSYECLRLIVEAGGDITTPDAANVTPLHRAAGGGHAPCVRLLLEAGSNPSTASTHAGATPLHYAVRSGNTSDECLRLLVEHGASPSAFNSDKESAAHLAAGCGDVISLKYLVKECGLDVYARDKDNQTMLEITIIQDHFEAFLFLIEECGVDVNHPCRGGVPPIRCAATHGREDHLYYLVSHGADVNWVGAHGRTLAQDMAGTGRESCLRMLVEGGAELGKVDHRGRVAIHYAALLGRLACLKFLVEECGVDFMAVDGGGESVLELAKKGGHMQCATYLQELIQFRPRRALMMIANRMRQPDTTLEEYQAQLGSCVVLNYDVMEMIARCIR